MIAHPIRTSKSPDLLAIFQLNFCQSPLVVYSLFNHPSIANVLILAIKEPLMNSHNNLRNENSGWHLIIHQPKDLPVNSRPRLCLYIKSRRHLGVQPINNTSKDFSACTVSACTVKVKNETILIINIYNQPKTFLGF